MMKNDRTLSLNMIEYKLSKALFVRKEQFIWQQEEKIAVEEY